MNIKRSMKSEGALPATQIYASASGEESGGLLKTHTIVQNVLGESPVDWI